MKIRISKSQWEKIGKQTEWLKKADYLMPDNDENWLSLDERKMIDERLKALYNDRKNINIMIDGIQKAVEKRDKESLVRNGILKN